MSLDEPQQELNNYSQDIIQIINCNFILFYFISHMAPDCIKTFAGCLLRGKHARKEPRLCHSALANDSTIITNDTILSIANVTPQQN